MKLSQLVRCLAVIPELQSTKKPAVIREMVAALANKGALPAEKIDDAVKAVQKRDELYTTGIGRGIAMPHAKLDVVDGMSGCIAVSRSEQGIDWGSIDGEPVRFLFLILENGDPKMHLQFLQSVSELARDDDWLSRLASARSESDILELL